MSQEFSHKNLLLTSPSRAFGCVQRYIQGPGELGHVFDYGKKYGDNFLFIIDSGVFDMIKGKIEAIEDKNGCSWMYESYFGECCKENVEALTAVVKQSGCNVVCGVGGGKVLDTVKLVADAADVARIILPTSASSDAPAADWAAVYDINGVHLGGVPTKRSTELVLVDSAIIATAPARLFAAGIADALVTWFEAVANEKAGTPNWIGRGYVISRAGMAIAKECYEVLVSEGKRAYEAVKVKALTPAVEDVIEANVLLSGLGFMNAGCAGAHGVHNGISEIEAGNAYLHGEKVAFGLVCELVLENADDELINSMLELMHSIDLPITMEQFGIECNDENLDIIVEHTVFKNALIHREPVVITPDVVRNAIIAANNIGHNFLNSKK